MLPPGQRPLSGNYCLICSACRGVWPFSLALMAAAFSDHIGQEVPDPRLRKQVKRNLWFLALLSCADGRVVNDHVMQETSELQLVQQMQRLLRSLALLSCADGRAVGDHVRQEASELQLLQQMQRLLWLRGPSRTR